MTGHVSEVFVDASMHVVVSKAEKHVPYRELVGTTESLALWPRCRANRGHYN